MRISADEIRTIARTAASPARPRPPPATMTLDGDRLTLSDGFAAIRATPARAAQHDQLLAAKRPAADARNRALACMRGAGPAR